MASLVSPLASGISGAASGSAAFYRSSTSTLASVYSDAEGVTAVTTHTLDANGGISRYVEERVDVVVLDVNGATVRTFTWGGDGRDARIENAYFSGPDATGAIVAGGRQTVDGALTKLGISLGTTDGNVLINGTAVALTSALSMSARVFNVEFYGAAGDGVADDGPKIQLAWNAAASAGGGLIYYPASNYLCTTPPVMPASVGKVTHLGEAASGTTITQANATTCWTLGNGNNNMILGLTFAPSSAANTGSLISVGTTARATFVACVFSALNGTTFAMSAATSSRVNCSSCAISQAGASSRIASGNSAYVRLEGCDITTTGGDLTSFSDSCFVMSIGTNWAVGSAISAGTTYVYNNSGGLFHFIGGEYSAAFTSGTVRILNAGALQISNVIVASAGATLTLVGSTATLFEAGCNFNGTGSANDSWPESPITLGTPADGHSATRARSYTNTTGAAVSYTPVIDYRVHEITSTAGAMAFNNPSTTAPTGWDLVIVYKNTNAGPVTPTFGNQYSGVAVAAAVVSGTTVIYHFVAKLASLAGGDYVCVSAQTAVVAMT